MGKGIDMSEAEARELKKLLEEYRTARQRWREALQLQGDQGISVRMMTDYSIIEQSVRSEIKLLQGLARKNEQGWKRENDGKQEQRRKTDFVL